MFKNAKKLTVLTLAAVIFSGFSVCAGALPPDPDNAATLYYQAFLLYDKAEGDIADSVVDVAKGRIPPSAEFKAFVNSNRPAIELALSGAKRKSCDWGVLYSTGFDAQMPHLGQVRRMTFLILADARVKAADGQIEQAIGQALAMKNMADHVNDGVLISFLVKMAVDAMTDGVLLDIVGSAKLAPNQIRHVAKALAATHDGKDQILKAMAIEKQVGLRSIRLEGIDALIKAVNPSMSAEEIKKKVTELGGEAFLEKCRAHYIAFMDTMLKTIASDMPYSEAYAALEKSAKKLEAQRDEPEAMLTNILAPALTKVYALFVSNDARTNAHLVALEIMAQTAETGKLPPSAPASPLDSFSGKPFKLTKTDAGFTLSANAKDLAKDEVQTYEFKVSR